MKGNIETACFHCSGGYEMIYASNRDSDWIHHTIDIRVCYDKVFDKSSGTSIILLSPQKTGMLLIVSKIIPNRYGDNLTAYLHIPNGLDVPGETMRGIVFDVISALAQNRKDVVNTCLSSISKTEYDLYSVAVIDQKIVNRFAYRFVSSESGEHSLVNIFKNLFQEYYYKYKFVFLAIDEQHVSNSEQNSNLTDYPLIDWRPVNEENLSSESKLESSKEEDSSEISHVEEFQTHEINSEWLKANTNIRGWLSFFFFAIIAGGIISAIIPIVTFDASDYADNFCLGAVDIVTGLLLLIVAILTVYSFISRKPNAVFWGKTYVLLVFITNILVLIGGGVEESGLQSTKQVVRGIIWGIIWFIYLSSSKQVEEIIPKSFRRISKTDWAMISTAVLLPIFLFVVGYSQINSLVDSRTQQESVFRNMPLGYNQRTDGRVIFTIPENFECESQDINSEGVTLTVFSINNDEIGSCTMCSDYDSDNTTKNFDSYWNSWKDEDIKKYSTENVDRGTIKINGNNCLYRITKHNVSGIYVYWRYYLLFDSETGKVFIASFYDTNNSTYYVEELLESVIFK